jgi:hypothetical protein
MNITQLKRQLIIEPEYLDDDALLQFYLNVAEVHCLNYLNLYTGSTSGYTGINMPLPIQQAVLLYASHLYTTRQPVSYVQGYAIPLTFTNLLDSYKQFTVV